MVAQCQPTKDELIGAIQIENGQFLVSTRDQRLLLYSNKIINGTFQNLFEISKEWPMWAISLFEIKNNFAGVSWLYDGVEADDTPSEDGESGVDYHKNDGLIIYFVNNNEIKEKKILEKKIVLDKVFFILLKDTFILQYHKDYKDEIGLFDLSNFDQLSRLKIASNSSFCIYPFNEEYFVCFV